MIPPPPLICFFYETFQEAREGHKVSPSITVCLTLSIWCVCQAGWPVSCPDSSATLRSPDYSHMQSFCRCSISERRPLHLHTLFSSSSHLPRPGTLVFLQSWKCQRIFNSGKKLRKTAHSTGVPIANTLLIYILSVFMSQVFYINRVELPVVAFFDLNSTGDEAL